MERTREVLAQNLIALMKSRPDLGTLKKITEASNDGLSNGKLDRIRRATHATDVDTLGELASLFGLETWQLLVPNLNPKALPVLAGSELLQTIKNLVLGQMPKGMVDRSHLESADLSETPRIAGKRVTAPGRFPGEVISSTGRGKGKSHEVDRPAKVAPARGRKRT